MIDPDDLERFKKDIKIRKRVIDKFAHDNQIQIIDKLFNACGIDIDYFQFMELTPEQQKAIYRDIKIKVLTNDNN